MVAMAGRVQLLLSPTAPVAGSCHHRLRRLSTPAWSRRPADGTRWNSTAAASSGSSRSPSSEKSAVAISSSGRRRKVALKLTYLEINSWVWEVVEPQQGGQARPVRILVDPLVVGNLDFGAPWLFDGAKKDPMVRALGVEDLLPVDLLLITQSLDDHCHVRTLTQLSAMAPDLPVVTTPNAQPVLASLPTPFRRVTYLEPGQSAAVSDHLRVVATAGPVLGPPWQRPENGYIILLMDGGDDDSHGLLYYEPHCVYDDTSFFEDGGGSNNNKNRRRLRADVVITPVVKQLLPANLTLVSGQEDAVDLARLLRARYVVPMSNGDVDAGGLLAAVISKQGTTTSFQAMLSEELPQVQVQEPKPGVPLRLELDITDDR